MAYISKQEHKEAVNRLRDILSPGDHVYGLVRSVSRSGMSRTISLFITKDGGLRDITYWAHKALEWPLAKDEGIRVGGCGMDMVFHTVYSLGKILWPEGFKTPEGYWRNAPLEFDPDGGYALQYHHI